MNIRYIKNKSKNLREKSNKILKYSCLFLLGLIFVVGLIVGILYFEKIVDENFFESNVNILENLVLETNKNKKDLFIESISRNIIKLISIWIIGLSILGGPILILAVIYDGFSLGITLSYILLSFGVAKGYSFIFGSMYIVTILNTMILFLLCNSAIKVTLNILKQKTSMRTEFIRHSTLCIIMLTFFIISSLIEVYTIK